MRPATSPDFTITGELALAVTVTPGSPKRIRRGFVAAATLDVDVVDEDPTETIAGFVSGAGQITLSMASGTGSVWLRAPGRGLGVFALSGPTTLLDPDALVALDHTVTTALGDKLGRTVGLARTARRAWELGGSGTCVLGTTGTPMALVVTPEEPLLVESGALVAYSSALDLTEPDDYRGRVARRGLKKLLAAGFDKLGVPIDPASGRDRVWLVAEGDGVIVVQETID